MTAPEPNLFPGEAVLFRTRLHWLLIVRHILSALTIGAILEVIAAFVLTAITFLSVRLPAGLDINKLNWATVPLLGLLPFLLFGIVGGLLDFFNAELIL